MFSSPFYLSAAVSIIVAAVGWIKLSQLRWSRQISDFSAKNHGYSTTDSRKDVLVIVSPTSGGGRAMSEYDTAIEELRAQGRHVEVYVTRSKDDLVTLEETKDLKHYTMIVLLAGDSSVFELVQTALHKCKGKWQYAPILHLPGGTGNALPGEFHGTLGVREIIREATTVRSGGVIKAYSEGSTRYALHNCFDGVQVALIDWLEANRAIHATFGEFGFLALILAFLVTVPLRRNINPIVLNICKSDFEGKGMNLGFGVNRFDQSMAAISGGPYQSKYELLLAYFFFLSGKLAEDIKSTEKLPYSLTAKVCDRYSVQGAGHYRLYFDGSSSLPLEGESIAFEVIPEAIPYYTVKQKT